MEHVYQVLKEYVVVIQKHNVMKAIAIIIGILIILILGVFPIISFFALVPSPRANDIVSFMTICNALSISIALATNLIVSGFLCVSFYEWFISKLNNNE